MTRGLHWFRNDLRLQDNTALNALAARVDQWLPVFVLDPRLAGGARRQAPRIRFLLDCLERLRCDLQKRGVPLLVREGIPEEVLPKLLHETRASLLSFNEDTTPFAACRDAAVRRVVERSGGRVVACSDRVVFRASDVLSAVGEPYAVYTPYRNAWWKRWAKEPRYAARLARLPAPIPGIAAVAVRDLRADGGGTGAGYLPTGGGAAARRRLTRFLDTEVRRYREDRDRPDRDGTSRLSPYLRFGVISVRQCIGRAEEAARTDAVLRGGVAKWLDELVWREFYAGILEQHPRVLRENYRREYDPMVWNDDPQGFRAWCDGQTGFPIVDAGMRQLRATGWMHNRARMVVASFLTKDLLIDWRAGARFFLTHLVDGDPASNNGGWQWAASTGTDAQPYFRIFNPIVQGKRWDPKGRYIRRWIPELRDVPDESVHSPWESGIATTYVQRIVDHAERRALALDRFRNARSRMVRR